MMQRLELRAGLGSELLDESDPRGGVGLQGLRLSAAAVQAEEQLGAETLPEGVLRGKLLDLGDELCVQPELEVCVDAKLERLQPQLLEVARGSPGRLAGKVGEGRSPPERKRLSEQRRRLRRLGRAGLLDEPPEAVEVELVRLDAQEVAWRPRHQPLPELPPEPQDVVLQRPGRRGRRVVAPDAVDQALARDDVVRLEQQQGCDRPPFRPTQGQPALAVEDLERTEDPKLHSSTDDTPVCRRPVSPL